MFYICIPNISMIMLMELKGLVNMKELKTVTRFLDPKNK